MQQYNRRYSNSNLIFAGDMNIESSNSFWPDIHESLDGGELFIDEMTSMSQLRFRSNDGPTFGLASNYDHFIFSPKLTPQCDGKGAKAFNFYTSWVADWIDEHYMIRQERFENTLGPNKPDKKDDFVKSLDLSILDEYELRSGAKGKIRRKLSAYTDILKARLSIHDNQIVWDDNRFEQRLQIYQKRIFFDQLENRTYYRIFFELLSDHFPVAMNCQNNK